MRATMASSPHAQRRLRYAGRCARCNAGVAAGDRGYYDAVTRKVHCAACGPAPTAGCTNAPGSSAQREYERRRTARETRTRAALPVLGGLVAALSQPQSEAAWARGAEGERRGAAALHKRTRDAGVILLHDRRRPGSSANIDHIAVGPGGVTVIDSKRLSGPIRVRNRGLLRPRTELRVAGRDRTSLIDGVTRQLEAVRAALAARDLVQVDVRGALQFVDGDLPLLGLPTIKDITLGPPRRIAKLARRPGAKTEAQIANIAALLEGVFPAA